LPFSFAIAFTISANQKSNVSMLSKFKVSIKNVTFLKKFVSMSFRK